MSIDALHSAHDRFTAEHPAGSWLGPLRRRALETFTASGFPSQREEAWKYTNLEPFAARTLDYLAPGGEGTEAAATDRLLAELPAVDDALRILVVNGQLERLPAGVEEVEGLRITSLAAADQSDREAIARRIAEAEDPALPRLSALNTAFLRDAVLIDIEAGRTLTRPLEIVYVADGVPVSVHTRLILRAGANSAVRLSEIFVSAGEAATNAVSRLHCENGARLDYVKLQAESAQAHHIAAQSFRLERDSRVDAVQLEVGGALSRNDLHMELAEPGAESRLNGLFVGNGRRHLDNQTRIDHAAPSTASHSSYRGIVSDRARGVFNGKIMVHRGADGTDASLENRNLLLSKQGEIDTKPELEIYADDVKCSHGATTGQLDPAAIFYLRTRGVAVEEARRVLTLAFAGEITAKLPWPALREYVERACSERIDTERAVEHLA